MIQYGIDPLKQQQYFDYAAALFKPGGLMYEAGYTKGFSSVSNTVLRREFPLSNATTQYTWDFQIPQGGFTVVDATNQPQPTLERGLNRNNGFFAFGMRYGIMRRSSNTPALRPDLFTYVDLNAFVPAAPVVGYTPLHLELAWNGAFQLTVNQKNYYNAYQLRRHRRVPVSQSGITGVAAATGVLDQFTYPDTDYYQGFQEFSPTVILMGDQTQNLQITFPATQGLQWAFVNAALPAEQFTNCLVAELCGFEIFDVSN